MQVDVGKFIEEYLKVSKNIKMIIFLIDIRHNVTDDDRLMYNYIIKQNIPCLVIANKADKIAITKVNDYVKVAQDSLNPLHDLTFLPFSAVKKIYTDNVYNIIEKYLI